MGKDSAIEWTDHTFNPWWGCVKVSPGCTHCYAETWARRMGHDVWGPAKTTPRREMSDAHWAQPLTWDKAAAAAGVRKRVFCASMADVFEDHPALPPLRARLFALIAQTPHLDWLLLTKRPENMRPFAPTEWDEGGWPANVWAMTTVENQEAADVRIPILAEVPARVRGLSCEPLIGPVVLPELYLRSIHWVIAGGESGAKARPPHPKWYRDLRDQCQAAGVAYLFKQHGEWISKDQIADFGANPRDPERFGWTVRPEWGEAVHGARWGNLNITGRYLDGTTTWNGRQGDPDDDYEVTVYRVGKKAAGRLLDGQAWDEVPS